jgi:2-polyprenyl-3-methyl-5-hydroxy-6-metoxy-1,4-benzoquinol methylase
VTDKTRFYDGIATEFDRIMNSYDLQRRLEVVFDQLLAGQDLRGLRVLDAGCGTGPFAAMALARGAQVVATDIGVKLLAVARQKVGPRVVAGDVTRLCLADASFDVVVSSECIEHTVSPRAAVHEMIRVLRPGGRLVITCPNRFWHWSCVLANAVGVRPYEGLENWPRWSELRRWVEERGVRIERHLGLHLFPFVLSATQPALRVLDRGGERWGPLYVNQCLLGIKPQA